MKLKSLIGNHETQAVTTKTASRQQSTILGAIEDAVNEASVKVASPAYSPAADLEKMASEVAMANREAEVGHVEKLGAAMADSFVRQLAAYETAAEKIAMEKAASMAVTAEELDFVRAARSNPQEFVAKVAEEASAYEEYSEKVASEVWENTAQDTVRAIHKTAMDHYASGYATVLEALQD